MTVKRFQPSAPKSRTELVRYLRDLADVIEAETAETDPRAALIVLTGPSRHEVLHVGHNSEPGFICGALQAAQAVYNAPFKTIGGNIRPRTHRYAGGPKRGDVVYINREGQADG